MLKQDNEPQLVDTTDLTDADWAEINKITGIRKARPKRLRKSFGCFASFRIAAMSRYPRCRRRRGAGPHQRLCCLSNSVWRLLPDR
jgi:hypothetical protein